MPEDGEIDAATNNGIFFESMAESDGGRKKSKSCLFYCIIYYYYFALPSHDLINRPPPLALSFPIISGSYNELAEVMEAGLEGKFPKSGMGELGGGMTKVRAQIQAE